MGEFVTRGEFEEHKQRDKERNALIQEKLTEHGQKLDDVHELTLSMTEISTSFKHMVDELRRQGDEQKDQGRRLSNIETTTANFTQLMSTTRDQEERIRELEKADGDKYKKIWASVWGAIIAGIIALGLSIFELKGIG